MKYILLIVLSFLVPLVLLVIDRKIKGQKSIIRKLLSLVLVMAILFGSVYLYGRQFLESFNVNVKSFSNIKANFVARFIFMVAMVLLFLFIFIKIVFLRLYFKTDSREINKEEKIIALATVFFDLALIPNIFSDATLVAVFAVVNMIEVGLVIKKLVFSITYKTNKEALAL